MFGCDYAWPPHPSISALKAAGVHFVCRYLSPDALKNLSLAEAQTLRSGGIDIVVVWESSANRALSGKAAGVADAQMAQAQAHNCGQPAGRPIYFGVDFDATVANQTAINDYFRGVGQVIGESRAGAYGGYYPIKRLFDAGLIRYGWQTYAWSGGQWDSRAQLQQYSNGRSVGGASCDFDRSVHDDFGQWSYKAPAPTPAPTPAPAPEPSLTDTQRKPFAAIWNAAIASGKKMPADGSQLLTSSQRAQWDAIFNDGFDAGWQAAKR